MLDIWNLHKMKNTFSTALRKKTQLELIKNHISKNFYKPLLLEVTEIFLTFDSVFFTI